MNPRAVLPPIALALCACAGTEVPPGEIHLPQPLDVPTSTPAPPMPPRPFVRIEQPHAKNADLSVTLNLREVTLAECLTRADPALNLVPATPEIDLSQRYSVRVNSLGLRQYLDILEGMTGYALELDPELPIVHVSSYLTRSWDVSTFASHGQAKLKVGQAVSLSSSAGSKDSEGSEGNSRSEEGAATVTYDHTDSPWEDLLANARSILGVSDAGTVPTPGAALQTWLVADQRLGLLRARGPVSRIHELDAWLTEQTRRGARQILMAVAILDVSREEGSGGGLDLSLLYDSVDRRIAASRTVPGNLSFVRAGGAWEVDAALEFGRWSLNAMVQQLSRHGQVTVRSDPVFTVVNGMTTFLGDGEEVSFIAGTDLVLGEGSREPVLATEFEHIRVGFRIAVTPRMRHDGSILVEVVPVLSSIRSHSEFETGVSTVVRPNIAIQEMATLAITRSGKPILLGGLIQSRSLQAAHQLDCDHFLCRAFATSTLEKTNRELMIVITPIEVAI